MKKTFRFLALSFALICGTLSSFAQGAPAVGTKVGAGVSGGMVTYSVMQNTPDALVDADGNNYSAYPVAILGLDADGIAAQQQALEDGTMMTLNIATSFKQKWGTEYYLFYVKEITGTDKDHKEAFWAMRGLETLTFTADASAVPASAFTFEVGQYAFYGCDGLTTLTFEDNVNAIGKYAFQNTSISDFKIPAKCANIGMNAFYNTRELKTVSVGIAEGAKNTDLAVLGKQVFANSAVSELDLRNAEGLTAIDDDAFIYDLSAVNAQLKTVKLPAKTTFTSLGTAGTCFANCTSLASIENLESTGVTAINPGAFENCENLTVLNFPATASINSDGSISPFLNCKKLTKLTFADKWAGYIAPDVYLSTTGNKIQYDGDGKYSLIPYTPNQAVELSYLEEIEFKGDVYGQIGAHAFGNANASKACSELATLTFGGTIYEGTLIGEGAFQNCANLATLTFAKNATEEKPIPYGFAISKDGEGDIVIAQNAFAGTDIDKVDFKNFFLKGKNTINVGIYINGGAFACDNLDEVTFGNIIYDNGTAGAQFMIRDETFVSDLLTTVTFGNVTGKDGNSVFYIGEGYKPVFEAKTVSSTGVLETVKFGHLTPGKFYIQSYAFKSELLKTVVIGDVIDAAHSGASLSIGAWAFGYPSVDETHCKAQPKTVTIGNNAEDDTNTIYGFAHTTGGTLDVYIADGAFYGDKLTKVTMGNLGANSVVIGYAGDEANAPFGGNYAEKTVSIKDFSGASIAVAPYAFCGTKLTSVDLGAISGNNVVIGKYAFSGDLLATVAMGDITSASQAEFGTYAFANTSSDTDDFTPIDETVTIGEFATTALNIAEYAFQGPKKEGSSFTVTIGKAGKDAEENPILLAGISKNPTIAASAFVGPAYGTTSYTLGDIDVATTGIAAKAFVGSRDNKTDKNNNTDVTIGDYNKKFQNVNTFTYVDDIVAKSWNCNQVITTFQNPTTLTILNDVTATLNGGGLNSSKLESLTIGGNVVSPAIINNFGPSVRNIAFTSEDPEVYEGAIASEAFLLASDDAMNDETISVIYRVKTASKSNAIFDVNAFGYDDAYKNVVLYTDDWSKANTFENVEIGGDPDHVYRMTLSASAVAPGETIKATCITGKNGKYSYGRLYIPAGTGMRYKVSSKYDKDTKKNGVNIFSATISGTDIYMNQLTVMEDENKDGYYWIDATEKAQTFIVRTSEVGAVGDKIEIEAEYVSQAEADALDAAGTVILATDWFDAGSAKKNALQYATEKIKAHEFQNAATTHNKGIYVMANPATRNLAFALYDQTASDTPDLKAGSVYVVTRADQYAARLNVIWPEGIDEENDEDASNAATGIEAIETEESNDAIYNLQGVRMNKTQKGINIINGKKVIK